jgi:hypothetical protein
VSPNKNRGIKNSGDMMSTDPTVIRAAILTRGIVIEGQSGFLFPGRFSKPQGVLLPPPDPRVRIRPRRRNGRAPASHVRDPALVA